MIKQQSLFIKVCCLVVLITSSARADGLIRDGVGAISIGRGGTNIGHSDNAAVLLDNPAGMINIQGNRFFEGGIDMLIPVIDYKDADPNNVANEFQLIMAPQFGYFRKSNDGRWAVGLGVYLPAGFSSELKKFSPIFGDQTYRSLGVLGKVLPGVAYQVTDRLSVGGTLGLGVSHMELEGPFIFQTGAMAGTPALFDLKANGTAMNWSLGMQYQLSEKTTLGLSYKSASKFHLEGKLDAAIVGLGPGLTYSQFDTTVQITWPRSLGMGITHLHDDSHRFSADVLWYDWSNAFTHLDMTMTDASNPVVIAALGSKATDRFPLSWRDSVSMRLGYEFFTRSCDVWRLGYVYHRRTAPNPTLTPYLDGILEHSLSIGHSTQWRDWRFNTAYQFAFGRERSVGQSAVVGGDFSNSTLKAQAHWLALSLSRQY